MQQEDDIYGAYTGTQDTDPNIHAEPQESDSETEPQTAPLGNDHTGFFEGMKKFFGGWNAGGGRSHSARTSQTPPPPRGNERQSQPDTRSAIEKMRDKVADFDEDYKDIGERVLGFFVQLVGYMGPFALVVWVGSDLGKFFSTSMGAVPAYGLSYTIECVIAACTVAMGRAFSEIASGRANYGKASMVVIIWLILNASSAFGLYLVITNYGAVAAGSIEQYSMIVRVCAIALADLGCSAVLMFKGRSIQKYIESVRKRAAMIGELSDAERSAKEADRNAGLREQQSQASLKIQEQLSEKIGDAVGMVMTSVLEKMEKSLNDEGPSKNDRRYGGR